MKKIAEIWNKLKLWHQVLLVLVVIAIGFSLFFVSTKPDPYNLLFSGLDAKEAIQIGTELSSMGIDYQLLDDNTTINVKTTDVGTIRMQLASKGLPSVSGEGFELFDGNKLGTSSFENNVNYTRAVTGSIEQTLVSGIDVVEKAQVQIPLIEKKRFFEEDEEPLTAKVIITPKAGKELTAAQVKGIQNFVAGAAKNLKPESVTVLNQNGEIVSDNAEGDSATSTTSAGYAKQQEIVNQTEDRIKADITKTLSGVFGYDNIKLTVRTDINFDEIVQNIEKYDPKGTMVSRQNKTEKSRNSSGTEQEAGTESNGDVVDYQLQDGSNGDLSTSDKEEIIENFEVGKTVETIRKNPELQNIIVSVYVDEKEIGLDKVEDLKESVALSAGLVDKDGDGTYENGAITVKTYEFNNKKESETSTPTQVESVKTFFADNKILIIILAVLLVIVIGLVAVLAIISGKKREEEERATERRINAIPVNADTYEPEIYMERSTSIEKETSDVNTKKMIDESVKLSQEDTSKAIDYIRKKLNER
ncbi:flagellar M-ring protein FliF [Priestia megaterium]|nr:flagellar M-ring protein FliF [Priestia megaterium]